MLSSLAATRATHPSTTLFRYTKGVLPINCGSKPQINTIYAVYKIQKKSSTPKGTRIQQVVNLLQLHPWQFQSFPPPYYQVDSAMIYSKTK